MIFSKLEVSDQLGCRTKNIAVGDSEIAAWDVTAGGRAAQPPRRLRVSGVTALSGRAAGRVTVTQAEPELRQLSGIMMPPGDWQYGGPGRTRPRTRTVTACQCHGASVAASSQQSRDY